MGAELMPSSRILALFGIVALLGSGCAQTPRSLYSWQDFPKFQYETLIQEGSGPDNQIQELEAQIVNARADHEALPPGLRAHLGMLYLGSGNPERAQQLWEEEKVAFPESTPYMNNLLQRLASKPVEPTQAKGSTQP